MATNVQVIPTPRPLSHDGRYYKVQIKGWTNFDPTGKELIEILSSVDQGGGVVTVVEVTEIANTIGDIKDVDIRDHFENAAAVERVVKKMNDLPKALREKLYSAVKSGSSAQEESMP